jgi:hypothetical protein
MSAKSLVLFAKRVALAGVATLLLGTAPVLAQSVYPGGAYAPANGTYGPPRYVGRRPLIVVTPRPLLYRRCAERLQLQYRPSGPVLFPLTYCWWVRG